MPILCAVSIKIACTASTRDLIGFDLSLIAAVRRSKHSTAIGSSERCRTSKVRRNPSRSSPGFGSRAAAAANLGDARTSARKLSTARCIIRHPLAPMLPGQRAFLNATTDETADLAQAANFLFLRSSITQRRGHCGITIVLFLIASFRTCGSLTHESGPLGKGSERRPEKKILSHSRAQQRPIVISVP
jgi:hypothetical protein